MLATFGLSLTASAQDFSNQQSLLNQFLFGSGSNCSVITESSNTYHQMYVNGEFKGNYQIGNQDGQLENMLYRYVNGGVCRMPTSNGGGYPPNPGNPYPGNPYPGNPYPGNSGSLITQFMRGASVNCSVNLEDSNTYHQMYVNGEFKGNYVIGSQDAQLENMLYRYINGGVCHMRY